MRPHQALIDIAAERPIGDRITEPELLLSTAIEHGMGGLLLSAIVNSNASLPAVVERTLAMFDLRVRRHHQRLGAALDEISSIARHAGLDIVTFKGVTAEERWFERTGERPARDLDLWLSPHQLNRADELVGILDSSHPLLPDLVGLIQNGYLQAITVRFNSLDVDIHFDPLLLGVKARTAKTLWDRRIARGNYCVLDETSHAFVTSTHILRDTFAYLYQFVELSRITSSAYFDGVAIREMAREEGISEMLSLIDAVCDSEGLPGRMYPADRDDGSGLMRGWILGRHGALRGHEARSRFELRSWWIPVLAKRRTTEALTWIARRIIPPEPLLRYKYPESNLPYIVDLVIARLRSRKRVS